MEVFGVLIVTVIAALFYVYWSFKKSYSYFECHGVPYLKPNFFFGNMADAILLRKSLSEVYREIYNNLASHKFGGVYVLREPTFIIRDPELVKNVLVKDFAYFCDRGISVNPEVDPLRCTLFHMKGKPQNTFDNFFQTTHYTVRFKASNGELSERNSPVRLILAK